MTASTALRALREALVLEHLESENEREFDTALGVFDHPRCEIVATGEVFDGTDEVAGYYARLGLVCADRRSTLIELHHADDAVIVEVELAGTHLPSLRAFRARMTAFFVFDGARLVGKRVYGGAQGTEPALT
ncbi:hypothetical protein GCM10022243_61110 [Saccharothrix violaceirubra]|uniref:Ketosteroid isomerase-like protein n=1 Tax=Saccharothrix violaceirubra TaxID=413306 RepID=A0A7W7WYD0_9PSEU|nr:nuclear transport factor 2 family protein [Saccharothrix violaceirubra]MBB4968087.1 ketosteroid isomerase-like protein [Saccharothrix violaceirubra]